MLHKKYKDFLVADMVAMGIKRNTFKDRLLLFILPPPIYKYVKLLRKLENNIEFGGNSIISKIKRKILFRQFGILGSKLSFVIWPFNCGPGLRLLHPGGIIINSNAKIGKNFTIRPFSVIGNKSAGDRYAVPTIGDNVEVGCNCSIIGKIHIGDNVKIGAGSVVVTDIPSNSICVGNPAKVIKKID